MQKSKNPALLLSLFLTGPAALAQYAPSIADLNAIFDPPMNIQSIICQYADANAQSICKDGSAAARWMAEKYAKNAGAYLGCVDGLSQGLNIGFRGAQNPTAEMTAQAAAFVNGSTFDSAVARAQEQARREGQTASADQIITRYRAVIGKVDNAGRPLLPNKAYEYPAIGFKGYEDGYDVDVLAQDPSFNAVYNAGWVRANDAWVDRVTASKLWSLQGDYAQRSCNQNETIFGRRNMPVMSFWDYYRNQGRANFENYGWNNSDWAWDILINYENTLDTYLTYVGINNLTKQVSETVDDYETRTRLDANGRAIPVKNPDGTQVVNAQGIPQFETERVRVGSHVVTRTVALSNEEKQVLRNAYLVGFKESYKRYYARQYASQNYAKVGLEKYQMGMEVGTLLGREVAQKTAMRNAYNAAYKNSSATAYAAEAKARYKASFDYLINIFERNPVLELNTALILGQTNDGIFRASEDLKVQFSATNLGEVSRPSTFSILASRDVTPTANPYVFSVPRLSSGSFVSDTLGRVVDNLRARSSINVTFGLQNPGDLREVARSLSVQKDQAILINDYLEVERVSPSMDYIAGSFTTAVDVINPAAAYAPITTSRVELNLGGAGSKDVNALNVPGGNQQTLSLTVSSIDPLAIIEANGLAGSVNTYVGDRLAHSVPVSVSINEQKIIAKLRYFDALATARTRNTGNASTSDRLAQLITTFNQVVRMDIGRGDGHTNVRWDDDGEVRQTLVYQIQRFYKESSNAGRMNAQAQAAYTQLGQTLAENVDQVRAGGFLRSAKANRKAYLAQLKVFAKI